MEMGKRGVSIQWQSKMRGKVGSVKLISNDQMIETASFSELFATVKLVFSSQLTNS